MPESGVNSPIPESTGAEAAPSEGGTAEAPPSEEARPGRVIPLWVIVALAGLFGGVVGLGLFTIDYASGVSYLSNDPAACATDRATLRLSVRTPIWERAVVHANTLCCTCLHENAPSS